MRTTVTILAALGLTLCTVIRMTQADEREQKKSHIPVIAYSMLDLDGTLHNLGQNDGRRVRAFVFLSTQCPISNGYLKTLTDMNAKFAGKDVDLFGVVADFSVTRAEVTKHFTEYKVGFPILFDSSGLLLQSLEPTHVPESFVLDRDGKLVYRGAIDNAWEAIGRRRPKAEKNFLIDAITAAVSGKVPVAETKPVGCIIEAPPKNAGKANITYARHIAPIVQARCLNCHREGQVAPFALADFEQTAKRAKQIVRVTHDRIMPPWIPSPGHDKFVGERWLTDRELELFKTWAETGCARGDDADLPAPPKFALGWRLGKPDLILKMSEPFTVPADGPDLLQHFVIPIETGEDKLVVGIEFHPGNKRVAHHSVLFLDNTGAARRLEKAARSSGRGPGYPSFGGPGFLPYGAIGGWSVGNSPRLLPNGMGRYLKKGSDLVMQMHYHPSGKKEVDQSEVGVYFGKKPVADALKEPAKLIGTIWMANYEMDIPAGEKSYRRSATYTVPENIIMVGVVPHMHLLGKSMKVTATMPDKNVKTLIEIKSWNYNWQDEYYYEQPFKLPAGTRLDVKAVYDNSADNPSNPSSPPKRVTWGDGTKDEMLFCFFLLSAEKTEDVRHVVFDSLQHDWQQPRKVVKKLQ
jgi:Redoxin/Copper type II ascorbate-dependent monooxygenase, C-terminal domain